ncbi:MAG TPA: trypsin-like peptidase domain-containing protein [Candidatus Dormibacteraeota bacterium]
MPQNPPGHSRFLFAALSLLAGLVLMTSGALVGLGIEHAQAQHTAPNATISLQNPVSAGGTSTANAIDKVRPAVVDINTVIQGVTQNGEAAGTGMIVSANGEVVTNNHVVQGATQIKVSIPNHPGTYNARVMATDATGDIALIQVENVANLPTVSFADSSKLAVGQHLTAIGNAFGRGGAPSITDGTITALDQSITASDGPGSTPEQLTGMIQTDAAISPGDSGGPLVNDSGQVVGMITAGQSSSRRQQTSTIGFAIPSGTAIGIVNQMRAGVPSSAIVYGVPAYLGVQVTNLSAGAAAQLGVAVTEGALVVGVVPGAPAASIGLGQYSVIVAVNGQPITSSEGLGSALHVHQPGQSVKVTWVNATGSHTATATLAAGPAA